MTQKHLWKSSRYSKNLRIFRMPGKPHNGSSKSLILSTWIAESPPDIKRWFWCRTGISVGYHMTSKKIFIKICNVQEAQHRNQCLSTVFIHVLRVKGWVFFHLTLLNSSFWGVSIHPPKSQETTTNWCRCGNIKKPTCWCNFTNSSASASNMAPAESPPRRIISAHEKM